MTIFQVAKIRVSSRRRGPRPNYTYAHLLVSSRIYWKVANNNTGAAPLALLEFCGADSLELSRLVNGTWVDVGEVVKEDSHDAKGRITVSGRLRARNPILDRDVQIDIIADTPEQHRVWLDRIRARIAPWELLRQQVQGIANHTPSCAVEEIEKVLGRLVPSFVAAPQSSSPAEDVEKDLRDDLLNRREQIGNLIPEEKLTTEGSAGVGTGASFAKLEKSLDEVARTAELVTTVSKTIAGVGIVFRIVSLGARTVSMLVGSRCGEMWFPLTLSRIVTLFWDYLDSLTIIMGSSIGADEKDKDFAFDVLKRIVTTMDTAEEELLRGKGSQIERVELEIEELERQVMTAKSISRKCYPTNDSATTVPIFHAWKSVEEQSLSLIDACETIIKSENTKRSVAEWCVAHDLLMQAVRTGAVPGSRDYKGIKLHWHLELYQHCNKLAIGKKEIGVLISLFREAEDVGVIAKGTCESFVSDLGIREDMEEDKWHSANAIYHLFLKQAETDARLQQVLCYQKVQQLTSVINAVLGFIPVGGSMAANVVSGGAAILNDFQVCGLVESLLGVSKDLSGGFGSNKLVDHFIRYSCNVLREDNWNQLEEDNKQVVKDASQNLGLTVDELRDRLFLAAEMMKDEQASNHEGNWTGEVEVVEEEETDYREGQETNTVDILNAPAEEKETDHLEEHETYTTEVSNRSTLVTNLEVSELSVNTEGAQVDLDRWANEPLSKASIEKLKGEEAASCLAAYLTNYDVRLLSSYVRLKDALRDAFSIQFIDGSMLAHTEGEHREEIHQVCLSAIVMMVQGLRSRNLGLRLKLFLDEVGES